MRRLLIALSLLPLFVTACQKEITEVRRDTGPVAPGSGYANTRSKSVAPTGKPQGPTVVDYSVKSN